VQKTSNGVKATLLALNADTLLVTGLANAKNSALYARRLAAAKTACTINIIASHADDDDDLACAEYIRDLVLDARAIDVEAIKRRIRESRPAQKFYDPNIPDALDARDITHCAREVACDFVMQVDKSALPPRIVTQRVASTSVS
jgi:2-phosphosulfolactate phosphatase